MLRALLTLEAQPAARLAAELGHGHVEVDGRLLLAGHHRRRALPQAHEVQAAREVFCAVLPQRPHRLHRQQGVQVCDAEAEDRRAYAQDCLGKRTEAAVGRYQQHTTGCAQTPPPAHAARLPGAREWRLVGINHIQPVVLNPRSLHATTRRKRALGHGRTSTKSSTRKTSWRRRECTQPSQARKSSSLLAHTSICAQHAAHVLTHCSVAHG